MPVALIAAAVGGAATIYGANKAAKSSKQASDTAAATSADQIARQDRVTQEARDSYRPYVERGTTSQNYGDVLMGLRGSAPRGYGGGASTQPASYGGSANATYGGAPIAGRDRVVAPGMAPQSSSSYAYQPKPNSAWAPQASQTPGYAPQTQLPAKQSWQQPQQPGGLPQTKRMPDGTMATLVPGTRYYQSMDNT